MVDWAALGGFLVFFLLGSACGLILGTLYALSFDHGTTSQKIRTLWKLFAAFTGTHAGVLYAYWMLAEHKGNGFVLGVCIVFIYMAIKTLREHPRHPRAGG